MADTPATKKPSNAVLPSPFTVEFGDPLCRQIHLQTFQRTLRGSWSNMKLLRAGGGRNLGEVGQSLPDIPGIHCTVDFRASVVEFTDPAPPEVWEDLNRTLQTAPTAIVGVGQNFGPVNDTSEPVDAHTLKTFTRELLRLVNAEKATVVKGTLPSLEEINELPGRYLFDPSWHSQWKPQFEDEYERWKERALDRV